MDCIKTNGIILDKDPENSVQNQSDTEDWYADFRSGTELAAKEAAKTSVQSSLHLIHDICTKDVRDFSITNKSIYVTVPCNPDGSTGCRGGLLPSGVPTISSIRISCADERLSPETGCDRIVNTIEFEVVLNYNGTLLVITPKQTVDVLWSEFKRFPSFQPFATVDDFRAELKKIDGSCKAIKIVNAAVTQDGNDCTLRIDYKIFDKLWKFEDLIILAVKPISNNTTVCDQFQQGHEIGPCTMNGSGTCCGG